MYGIVSKGQMNLSPGNMETFWKTNKREYFLEIDAPLLYSNELLLFQQS